MLAKNHMYMFLVFEIRIYTFCPRYSEYDSNLLSNLCNMRATMTISMTTKNERLPTLNFFLTILSMINTWTETNSDLLWMCVLFYFCYLIFFFKFFDNFVNDKYVNENRIVLSIFWSTLLKKACLHNIMCNSIDIEVFLFK